MKTKDGKSKNAPRTFSLTRWRKLYVSAIHAQSGDFIEAEPSGNLARIFVGLLLVHVFLIGSVVIYNIVVERPRVEHAITTPAKSAANTSAKPAGKTAATEKAQMPALGAVAPVQMQDYEVGSGDSIPSIAQKFGVSAEELLGVNNLDNGGEIYPGRKLNIPTKIQAKNFVTLPSQAAPTQPVTVPAFVVTQPQKPIKKEESSQVSASSDSVPKATLVKTPDTMGKVQDNSPKLEKKVEKPDVAAVREKTAENKATVKPATEKQAATARTYTTTSKDTFYSVARKFKVKVDDLMWLNGMKDPSKLREGVKLKIPAKD